jgi:CYTH domain-containing protein
VRDRSYAYEIDEYKQVELTVVEVEFPDLDASERFVPPAWFGRELGQEEEYRNKTLWLKLQSRRPAEEGGDRLATDR